METALLSVRERKDTTPSQAKGVPAVVFAAAPVLARHCRRLVGIGLLAGGRGSRLCVVLVVLVEVAILHHAEAGGGAQVLAAALVLLDGLVERPQLAEEGHVLLTQPHLEETGTGTG